MKKLVGLCLLTILAGCAGNSPDTKVPSEKCMQLSPILSAKMQTIRLEHLNLEFLPGYDKNKGVVEAEGQITLNQEKIPVSANIYNFKMKVYLLDKGYKILNQISIRNTIGWRALDGLPFEMSFSYKSEYEYISFDYSFDFNHDFAYYGLPWLGLRS